MAGRSALINVVQSINRCIKADDAGFWRGGKPSGYPQGDR